MTGITPSGTFLDVTFRDGVLEMTRLEIEDYSVPLIQNFIAFDQCNIWCGLHFSSYARFMEVVKGPMDVVLLGEKRSFAPYFGL